MPLKNQKCIPCSGSVPPLTPHQQSALKSQIHADWQMIQNHHLKREILFPDFKAALAFTNQVGELAETEGHHPDIYLAWGKVGIEIWTHKIDGLTESDFILAAKIDTLQK